MSKKFPLILLGLMVVVASAYFIFSSYTVKSTEMKKQAPSTSQSNTSSELKVEDTKIGTGKEVKSGDTVIIHYNGTLTNGTKFDSSYDRGQPFETVIGVGKVIQGWDQGVVGMKVGGKRKLIIPPELGYGTQAVGPIPANSTLIFEVELIDVK